jgi:hypothetical protein
MMRMIAHNVDTWSSSILYSGFAKKLTWNGPWTSKDLAQLLAVEKVSADALLYGLCSLIIEKIVCSCHLGMQSQSLLQSRVELASVVTSNLHY